MAFHPVTLAEAPSFPAIISVREYELFLINAHHRCSYSYYELHKLEEVQTKIHEKLTNFRLYSETYVQYVQWSDYRVPDLQKKNNKNSK